MNIKPGLKMEENSLAGTTITSQSTKTENTEETGRKEKLVGKASVS